MFQDKADAQDNIILETIDEKQDQDFIKNFALPYFKDLFTDLAVRDSKEKNYISKVILQEVRFGLLTF